MLKNHQCTFILQISSVLSISFLNIFTFLFVKIPILKIVIIFPRRPIPKQTLISANFVQICEDEDI